MRKLIAAFFILSFSTVQANEYCIRGGMDGITFFDNLQKRTELIAGRKSWQDFAIPSFEITKTIHLPVGRRIHVEEKRISSNCSVQFRMTSFLFNKDKVDITIPKGFKRKFSDKYLNVQRYNKLDSNSNITVVGFIIDDPKFTIEIEADPACNGNQITTALTAMGMKVNFITPKTDLRCAIENGEYILSTMQLKEEDATASTNNDSRSTDGVKSSQEKESDDNRFQTPRAAGA